MNLTSCRDLTRVIQKRDNMLCTIHVSVCLLVCLLFFVVVVFVSVQYTEQCL